MNNKQNNRTSIPSREELFQCISERKKLTEHELIESLALQENQLEGTKKRLNAMQRDGQISKNKQQQYHTVASCYLTTLKVYFDKDGSMLAESGQSKHRIYIPHYYCHHFLSGDTLELRVSQPEKNSERYRQRSKRHHWIATPIQLIDRSMDQFIGQIQWSNQTCYVVPFTKKNKFCRLPVDQPTDLKQAQFVNAQVIDCDDKPMVKILSTLGDFDDKTAMTAVLKLNYDFDSDSYTSKHNYPVDTSPQDIEAREDLTQVPFFTIDGESSRDFDDAVFVAEREDGPGWIAYIAIADVSHYVKVNSDVDEIARHKSTSVYLPHEVSHMLPTQLSEDLCSLKPHENRRAMVLKLCIDGSGARESYSFHYAMIKSHARLTYQQVDHWLDGIDLPTDDPYELLDAVNNMQMLTHQLLIRRKERGALEIHSPSHHIQLDDNDMPTEVVEKPELFSAKMIEELMLLTNVTVAEYLHEHKEPCLYRSHSAPRHEKLNQLKHDIQSLGLESFQGNRITTKQLNRIIEDNRSSPWFHMINDVILRAQNQAVYSAKQEGHYGLGYSHYCHFTSPIRRYPDLVIHRILKSQLGIEPCPINYRSDLKDLCDHCTMREKSADEAQRTAEKWFKCVFMKNKMNHVFDGIVVKVMPFGLFVRLNRYNIDGLLPLANIDGDYYQYNSSTHQLESRSGERSFKIGDGCQVKIESISMIDLHINFMWVDSC